MTFRKPMLARLRFWFLALSSPIALFGTMLTAAPFHAAASGVQAVLRHYAIPELSLIDSEGHRRDLREVLGPDHGIVLSFVFTSCTTICPILLSTMARLQERIGSRPDLRYVAVSIDPGQDTPRRLRELKQRYGAADDWVFLTGSFDRIEDLQRRFDAWSGNKMSHRPLIFMRRPEETTWLRVDGFASPAELQLRFGVPDIPPPMTAGR